MEKLGNVEELSLIWAHGNDDNFRNDLNLTWFKLLNIYACAGIIRRFVYPYPFSVCIVK